MELLTLIVSEPIFRLTPARSRLSDMVITSFPSPPFIVIFSSELVLFNRML
jgi:hypothetical protein